MNTIQTPVVLNNDSYHIYINDHLFDFSAIESLLKNRKIAIISNTTIAPIYLDKIIDSINPINSQIFSHFLDDGEQYKNKQSWSSIIDFLASNNFNRSDLLISLGGGVICDITGFAASSWMRGIDFIQVPTSLLAQVDASVGGKTGINHHKGKNLIGAFHQPIAVIINTSTLNSLPCREFKSGLGEALKYGLINQPLFTQWLNDNSKNILAQDLTVLTQLISKCCQFKTEIVQQDEKESGIRALLNLGHTFAHAIETFGNYQEHTHGEAVGIGMVMAAELSDILNLNQNSVLNHNLRKDVEKHLQDFDLLTMLPKEFNSNKLIELMRLDKKVMNNKHRLILLKSLGNAYIQNGVCEKDILQAIENCQY